MGWERKRGKLARVQPVRARRDATTHSRRSWATPTPLRDVRYVITLDADTVLPPDAAPLLVGTLAHPLNRAVYDAGARTRRPRLRHPPAARRRVAPERAPLACSRRSTRAIPGWIPTRPRSPTCTRTSIGEGSFTGKGIYDVDAFERATAGRFPENTLLSHDLIEGSYARAGLATDIRSTTTTRRATSPSPAASIAGSAATGSCSAG